MTSSRTSTEKPTRRAPSAWAIAAVVVTLFVLLVMYRYHFRPTGAVLFLTVGWISLLGAAVLLWRAARSFDLTPGDFGEASDPSSIRRAELESEKKSLLKAIKEMEFDVGLGKVDPEDADVVIARYRARAIELIRLLEESTEVVDPKYQEIVEGEIARRAPRPPAQPTCAGCGTNNDEDAAFCKKCGTRLQP